MGSDFKMLDMTNVVFDLYQLACLLECMQNVKKVDDKKVLMYIRVTDRMRPFFKQLWDISKIPKQYKIEILYRSGYLGILENEGIFMLGSDLKCPHQIFNIEVIKE